MQKKAKWLSGEALQIAVKRREVKSEGEKERYKHLNAEFQRIARRDKKAFLSNQCKDIEKTTKQENGCLERLTNSCEKKRSEKQGEKERYKHLNAEFQRIARRD